ncbi:MAG: DUF5071 domain-containing protein [Clostridia bacterium]|nr:DUF5071 domain-containing protein [Clostridia bacterium]
MWDNQLSNEENEAKAQKGIDAAKQIKNLFPFMQPIIVPPEKSKLVWEPCAKIIAMRSDKELEPFMFKLLEWIQDLNWPGAIIIYDRLTQIPFNTMEFALKHSHRIAERTNDLCWLAVLDALYDDITKKA